MELVGVPNVEDLLVQLPPNVVEPLVVVLTGQLEQGVVLVHLGLVVLELLLQGGQLVTGKAALLGLVTQGQLQLLNREGWRLLVEELLP